MNLVYNPSKNTSFHNEGRICSNCLLNQCRTIESGTIVKEKPESEYKKLLKKLTK